MVDEWVDEFAGKEEEHEAGLCAMRQLAVERQAAGTQPNPPVVSIGNEEVQAVSKFLTHVATGKASLSGYLAG